MLTELYLNRIHGHTYIGTMSYVLVFNVTYTGVDRFLRELNIACIAWPATCICACVPTSNEVHQHVHIRMYTHGALEKCGKMAT